ncbi:MAG: sodium-dependent transporter [Parahaliea sp.]
MSAPQRQQFNSSLTAFWTMAGAAIGLGNVWRFPYMMGQYGGTAFLLVYLVFICLLAIPALMAEWSLGREARGGTITAFSHTLGPRWGRGVGFTLIFGMFCSSSYYLVVVGNVGYTAFYSTWHGFAPEQVAKFERGLVSGTLQYSISLVLLVTILWVAWRGLNKGIEQVSNLFVPFFFLVILYLIYSTFQLPGSTEKMVDYLRPDWSQINWQSVFAALGQAVFSVGLGGTIMVIYGSYLRSDTRLLPAAVSTAAADTGAAFMASLFIFPTMLVFGVAPDAGPKLIFHTLPNLFGVMAGGRVLGSFFLWALFLVAFLSGLAALEVIIGSLADDAGRTGITRKRAIVLVGGAEVALGALPAFKPDVIGIMDLFFGSGMLAVGSALALLALTRCVSRAAIIRQLGGESSFNALSYQWLRWVVPPVFIIIIAGSVLS